LQKHLMSQTSAHSRRGHHCQLARGFDGHWRPTLWTWVRSRRDHAQPGPPARSPPTRPRSYA